jgi:hypothetical protein
MQMASKGCGHMPGFGCDSILDAQCVATSCDDSNQVRLKLGGVFADLFA